MDSDIEEVKATSGDRKKGLNSDKTYRSRFQFNLTNLFLLTGAVGLLIAARIHTEKYFGQVIFLATIFAVTAWFVTKVLRIPNDGRMRRDYIRDD